jgi:hypothetical protein
MPAHNLRFGAMAAVTRMKRRYEFEMSCAAESVLKAATAPSRWVVVGNARERCRESSTFREESIEPTKL